MARHDRIDDVGIGLAPGRGQAGLGDAPERGELGPRRRVVVGAVARHRGGEARLAGAHGVALAGDGERRRARQADIAGEQGDRVDERDSVGALHRVVHAHGPRDRAPLGAGDRAGQVADGVGVDAALVGRPLDRPGGQVDDQVVEAVDVAAHGVEIDEVLPQHHGEHTVEQGDVAPGPHRQVGVGDHRRLGHPGVDHDDPGRAILPHHPRHEQRVVVGHVRAPQHEDVGQRQIVVAAGRAVGAEAELVAGHRGRHAQCGVAVVVGEAHAEADQLAQRVELLGHELAGRQHRHRLGPVAVEQVPKPGGHPIERPIPGRRSAVDQGHREPAVGRQHLVLGQALGAQPPLVDRVVGVALDGDRPAVTHADAHAAAHRAVAAGRPDPAVDRPAGADRPTAGLVDVGVPVAAVVGADPLPHAVEEPAHQR